MKEFIIYLFKDSLVEYVVHIWDLFYILGLIDTVPSHLIKIFPVYHLWSLMTRYVNIVFCRCLLFICLPVPV